MKNIEIERNEKNKYKKRANFFIFIIIILVIFILYYVGKGFFSQKDDLMNALKCQEQLDKYFINQSNQSIDEFKKEVCEDSVITKTINSFFENFFKLDKPWIIKFLVFIGVIYLIQVMFALVLDIVEVFVLIFVIIKRIYKWIAAKLSV